MNADLAVVLSPGAEQAGLGWLLSWLGWLAGLAGCLADWLASLLDLAGGPALPFRLRCSPYPFGLRREFAPFGQRRAVIYPDNERN